MNIEEHLKPFRRQIKKGAPADEFVAALSYIPRELRQELIYHLLDDPEVPVIYKRAVAQTPSGSVLAMKNEATKHLLEPIHKNIRNTPKLAKRIEQKKKAAAAAVAQAIAATPAPATPVEPAPAPSPGPRSAAMIAQVTQTTKPTPAAPVAPITPSAALSFRQRYLQIQAKLDERHKQATTTTPEAPATAPVASVALKPAAAAATKKPAPPAAPVAEQSVEEFDVSWSQSDDD